MAPTMCKDCEIFILLRISVPAIDKASLSLITVLSIITNFMNCNYYFTYIQITILSLFFFFQLRVNKNNFVYSDSQSVSLSSSFSVKHKHTNKQNLFFSYKTVHSPLQKKKKKRSSNRLSHEIPQNKP